MTLLNIIEILEMGMDNTPRPLLVMFINAGIRHMKTMVKNSYDEKALIAHDTVSWLFKPDSNTLEALSIYGVYQKFDDAYSKLPRITKIGNEDESDSDSDLFSWSHSLNNGKLYIELFKNVSGINYRIKNTDSAFTNRIFKVRFISHSNVSSHTDIIDLPENYCIDALPLYVKHLIAKSKEQNQKSAEYLSLFEKAMKDYEYSMIEELRVIQPSNYAVR